jgi:hypothetical protein
MQRMALRIRGKKSPPVRPVEDQVAGGSARHSSAFLLELSGPGVIGREIEMAGSS